MLLPTAVDRAALRSFWLVMSLGVGMATALLLLLVGVADLWGRLTVAAALTIVVAAPGLLLPYLVWPAYRVWNWAARHVAARAIRYVTAVCFFTVVRALSLTTPPARFETASDAPSMWKPRGTQAPSMYPSLYHDEDAVPQGSWTRPLRAWRRSSHHPEAWGLLPFLWLIRVLDVRQRQQPGASGRNYTLY